MNGNDWAKFVNKTLAFDVDTIIECGAHCNSHDIQCDMFILQKTNIRSNCHLGSFENDQPNYFNGVSEEAPVYLGLGNQKILIKFNSFFMKILTDKMMQDLENTYLELTYVNDESYWKHFIYMSKTLPMPADFLDCSFICRNVEKDTGCDLFLMEV